MKKEVVVFPLFPFITGGPSGVALGDCAVRGYHGRNSFNTAYHLKQSEQLKQEQAKATVGKASHFVNVRVCSFRNMTILLCIYFIS